MALPIRIPPPAPPPRVLLTPPGGRDGAGGAGPTRRGGIAACLLSALCFGALPVLGKAAFDAGVGPFGLLWARFTLAGVVFWALVAHRRRPGYGGSPRARAGVDRTRPPARWRAAGVAMGAAGYALEATLFFLALERVDASLTELLLYAHPAIVTVAALLLGRERPSLRLAAALPLATVGVVLVFAGSLATGAPPAGLALGLGAATVYAGYVLAGERVVARVDPLLLAALVSTGAAAAFTAAGVAGADLRLPATAAAWGSVVLVALVATVIPMVALFAGIERVGASTASIVSTVEPVVTVGLAAAVLGERLTGLEALGAAAVVGAVLLLRRPGRRAAGGEDVASPDVVPGTPAPGPAPAIAVPVRAG